MLLSEIQRAKMESGEVDDESSDESSDEEVSQPLTRIMSSN